MTDIDLALKTLNEGSLAFALAKDGVVVATGTENGIQELLAAADRLGPAARGCSLADKVVGKAVALIAAGAGFREVHARLASEPAVALLRNLGIPMTAPTIVPAIINRRRDGLCPLEQLSLGFDDPDVALPKLREFFAARRAREAAEATRPGSS